MKEIRKDVAIVGAGPIGLEMAAGLKRAGIQYVHLEKGQIAQTITRFPPQTRFFSSADRIAIADVPVPTVDQPKCTREEYLAYLRSIVSRFDLEIRTYEPVVSLLRSDSDGFILRTSHVGGERVYNAGRVVLAVGDMDRPRFLNIPGEVLPHVSHYLEEPHKYFRRKVLIVGGKNSAVEAALRCHHVGADVTVSYRRDAFDPKSVKSWILPEFAERVKRGEIRAHLQTVPVGITPSHVTLIPVGGGKTFDVEADFVLLLVGYIADMTLFRMAGSELQSPSEAPVLNEQTMETTVPGLYTAGTAVAGTQHSYKLFIENCHVHVDRIVSALTGTPPPPAPEIPDQLEA